MIANNPRVPRIAKDFFRKEVEDLRKMISRQDDEISMALLRRSKLVHKMQKLKQDFQVDMRDPSREEEVLKRVDAGLYGEEVARKIWTVLFEHSRFDEPEG